LHRYKNSRAGSRMEPLFRLLSEEQMAEAEVLGKAMRFGAMFSINQAEEAGTLEWHPRKKVLELRLTEYGAGLMGEVAQSRFGALVQALKATSKISLAKTA
jgi:exopolyphosphatase/guanosine-5'-triphosphate,3'-diphosphate pyrophosphatase